MQYLYRKLIFLFFLCFVTFQAFGNFSMSDHIEIYRADMPSHIETIEWPSLEGKINTDQVSIEDKVTSQNSSVSKSKKSKSKSEEMVFYSYAEPKKSKATKPKIDIKTLEKLGFTKNSKPKAKKIVDYSSFIQSSYSKKQKGQFKIQLSSIGKRGRNKGNITNFDLVPYYDLNEVLSDNGTGSLSIPVTSHGHDYSTFRASVAARGIVRTNFEVSAQVDLLMDIPVFEVEAFNNILEKEQVSEEFGSHFLIDLGSDLDSTTIEGKYKKKVYLNERLRIVEEGSRYRYEMYLDVEPGNHMVKYMNMKGKVAEKIIHISGGEITYDEPLIERSKHYELDLYEENLISKKMSKIDIDRKFVTFFNKGKGSNKIGLNRYKINIPIRDASFRNYVSVGDEAPIYLGFRKLKKATLPSEEYVNYIKKLFRLDESSRSCIIQVNLTNFLKDFRGRITSSRDTGSYDVFFMDKDGTFSQEMTGLSERVFIVSHDFGVMNARLDYTNGKTEYLQSFCTDNLYLVEQL